MTKDRLKELREMEEAKRKKGLFKKLFKKNDAKNPEKVKMLPTGQQGINQFREQVEHFTAELDVVEKQIEGIRVVHATLLSQPPSSGSSLDLNKKTAEAQRQLRKLSKKILDLKASMEDTEEHSASSRINREQMNRLVRSLTGLTGKFNHELEDFAEKNRKKCRDYVRIFDATISDEAIDEAIEQGTISGIIQRSILAENEKKTLLNSVKHRTEDILCVEKSIRELHEMFIDLQLLVMSQGDMVNNIERAAENAAEYTERGNKNLKEALKKKRFAQKLKIASVIGLILIVGAVVIIVFVTGAVSICALPFLC